jgi:hypothetical protein
MVQSLQGRSGKYRCFAHARQPVRSARICRAAKSLPRSLDEFSDEENLDLSAVFLLEIFARRSRV